MSEPITFAGRTRRGGDWPPPAFFGNPRHLRAWRDLIAAIPAGTLAQFDQTNPVDQMALASVAKVLAMVRRRYPGQELLNAAMRRHVRQCLALLRVPRHVIHQLMSADAPD